MEYLTIKILYSYHNQKHVTLLHSKRKLKVLTLHLMMQNIIGFGISTFGLCNRAVLSFIARLSVKRKDWLAHVHNSMCLFENGILYISLFKYDVNSLFSMTIYHIADSDFQMLYSMF